MSSRGKPRMQSTADAAIAGAMAAPSCDSGSSACAFARIQKWRGSGRRNPLNSTLSACTSPYATPLSAAYRACSQRPSPEAAALVLHFTARPATPTVLRGTATRDGREWRSAVLYIPLRGRTAKPDGSATRHAKALGVRGRPRPSSELRVAALRLYEGSTCAAEPGFPAMGAELLYRRAQGEGSPTGIQSAEEGRAKGRGSKSSLDPPGSVWRARHRDGGCHWNTDL
ncbi:hypothetical protein C8Q78DRAFT_583041 [Trametes maxima]|nr:hypothetical protein C8Q78DRAFT_583041 [Trametes maxima]